MSRRLSALAAATTILLAACSDGIAPDAALTVDFRASSGHINIWETAITYTALITAGDRTVNDFETLQMEYAPVGGSTWTKFGDLTLQSGGSYADTMYFPVAGTYNIRLQGRRTGQSAMQTIFQPATSITPVRQHVDVGTWRVEFEPSPGLNQAGEAPTVKFYVMQATAGTDGVRAPVTGLTGVTIRCVGPNATSQTHEVTETPAGSGAFSASHTFVTNGWAKAILSFTGPGGQPATATGNFGIGNVVP